MLCTPAGIQYRVPRLETERHDDESRGVGIVVPSYKEYENIAALVLQIHHYLPNAHIVVVDDSPTDGCVTAVEELRLPQARIVHRQGKGGRGSAVLDGMQLLVAAGCTTIIEMDSDFSHPPSQLHSLLAEARGRQLDLLIASRYLPGSAIHNWPLSRRLFSKFANVLARAVLQVPAADYTNGYRLYSRPVAEMILQNCGKMGKGFIPLSEILVNAYYRGFKIGETPTVFTNRVRGESSVNFEELKNAAVGLCKIFMLKQRLAKHKP